jgi:tetratricopeptide (TPR) repeat protein
MQPKCKPSFQPKPQKKEPEPTLLASKPQQVVVKKLKDSIYFQSDEEYEYYLKETLEQEGLFQELYDQLKVLYVSRKNIPALMSLWENLNQLGMSTYQACLEQAEVFIQMEEMQKAFVYLDRAVRLEPENLKGIRAIALYHKLNREYELTIHWLEKWKKLNMDDAEVYYHMGSVYRRNGMMEMALTELRRCLHLNHNHLMARSLLTKMGY